MIPWLDFKIFGSGHGMAVPYFDDRFYWLVDTYGRDRDGRYGEFYKYSAGLGAQLTSYQWAHPRAGERRRLANHEFVVFHSRRSWGRVSVSWAMTGLSRLSLDDQNAAIRELETNLGRSWA